MSLTLKFLCLSDLQASPGIIANPFVTGIVRKNSLESISSIDRDLSPEEIDIMEKVRFWGSRPPPTPSLPPFNPSSFRIRITFITFLLYKYRRVKLLCLVPQHT